MTTMKTIKKITFALMLLLVSNVISYAQSEKTLPKASHGGIMKVAGDYFIEILQTKDQIKLFVLDSNKKPLANKKISGSGSFEYFNKSKSTSLIVKDKK